MDELVLYIVKNLVSKPDSVKVEASSEEGGVSLQLYVDPSDMGLIIGKSGQTIKAIRKLLISRALAESQNIRVNLSLQEAK